MDWLLHLSRQVSGKKKEILGFRSTYFKNKKLNDPKNLIFHSLQILSFIKNKKNIRIKQTLEIEDEEQGSAESELQKKKF